jgi:heat shock protein HslJ
MMKSKKMFLVLLAGLLVNSCSSGTNKKTPKPMVGKADLSLKDSQWQLRILHGSRSLAGTAVSLHFAQGKVNGWAGCNSYSGLYSKTSAGACRFSKITLTEKTCQPDEVMTQERAFATALKDTAACALAEDKQQLFLKDKEGTVLAMLTAPQETEEEAEQELPGTAWRADSFSDGQGGMIQLHSWHRPLTVKFGKDGQLGGSAGCNTYSAVCAADPADLSFKFDMIKMTAKQCSPERVMIQEGSFMAALYSATSYQLTEDTLILKDAEGSTAVILKRN